MVRLFERVRKHPVPAWLVPRGPRSGGPPPSARAIGPLIGPADGRGPCERKPDSPTKTYGPSGRGEGAASSSEGGDEGVARGAGQGPSPSQSRHGAWRFAPHAAVLEAVAIRPLSGSGPQGQWRPTDTTESGAGQDDPATIPRKSRHGVDGSEGRPPDIGPMRGSAPACLGDPGDNRSEVRPEGRHRPTCRTDPPRRGGLWSRRHDGPPARAEGIVRGRRVPKGRAGQAWPGPTCLDTA